MVNVAKREGCTRRTVARGLVSTMPLAALLALVAACQHGLEEEQAAAPGASAQITHPDTAGLPEPAKSQVGAAMADVASNLGKEVASVKLLEVREVYWRTSALGCPGPGMAYAQVLTKGRFIRLAVGVAEYRFHASEDGKPFTCSPQYAEPPLDWAVE